MPSHGSNERHTPMIIRSIKCRAVVSSLLIASALLLLGKSLYAQTPDTNALKAAGIRTLKSKHLTLYTDLPAQAAVEDRQLADRARDRISGP